MTPEQFQEIHKWVMVIWVTVIIAGILLSSLIITFGIEILAILERLGPKP